MAHSILRVPSTIHIQRKSLFLWKSLQTIHWLFSLHMQTDHCGGSNFLDRRKKYSGGNREAMVQKHMYLRQRVFLINPTARTEMMGMFGIDWAISLTKSLLLSSVSVYPYYSNSIFLLLPLREVTYVWTSKPVVSHTEEETISLSVFFYCIWAFLCRCCSFNLSLPVLFVANSSVLCHCFKAMSPDRILP